MTISSLGLAVTLFDSCHWRPIIFRNNEEIRNNLNKTVIERKNEMKKEKEIFLNRRSTFAVTNTAEVV